MISPGISAPTFYIKYCTFYLCERYFVTWNCFLEGSEGPGRQWCHGIYYEGAVAVRVLDSRAWWWERGRGLEAGGREDLAGWDSRAAPSHTERAGDLFPPPPASQPPLHSTVYCPAHLLSPGCSSQHRWSQAGGGNVREVETTDWWRGATIQSQAAGPASVSQSCLSHPAFLTSDLSQSPQFYRL